MNLSTLPDSHPVYVDGHGAATAGDLRHRTESERIADTEDVSKRYMMLDSGVAGCYNPLARIIKDGSMDLRHPRTGTRLTGTALPPWVGAASAGVFLFRLTAPAVPTGMERRL